MLEIERPGITTVEQSDDGTRGVFEVEPLERGFGITLGNSLRRILISSLPVSFTKSPPLPESKKTYPRSF